MGTVYKHIIDRIEDWPISRFYEGREAFIKELNDFVFEKLNFAIIKSRYFKHEERGKIQNVMFRNIDVTVSTYNPGYSISTIGGYDANHLVENIVFDNLKLDGKKVLNADQLDLFTKQVKGIVFK